MVGLEMDDTAGNIEIYHNVSETTESYYQHMVRVGSTNFIRTSKIMWMAVDTVALPSFHIAYFSTVSCTTSIIEFSTLIE